MATVCDCEKGKFDKMFDEALKKMSKTPREEGRSYVYTHTIETSHLCSLGRSRLTQLALATHRTLAAEHGGFWTVDADGQIAYNKVVVHVIIMLWSNEMRTSGYGGSIDASRRVAE